MLQKISSILGQLCLQQTNIGPLPILNQLCIPRDTWSLATVEGFDLDVCLLHTMALQSLAPFRASQPLK